MDRKWVQRALNRLYIMVAAPIKEKQFVFQKGEEPLRYLFFRKKGSPVLVVGFQACNEKGARYNYVGSICGVRANRLYIKDDFAENHRGNYYLGRNGTYFVEASVLELIDRCKAICNATKLIFIGSSKGAYAAINFGICYKGGVMIVAAPQYYIGTYLNCETFLPNLKDILGEDIRQDQIMKLDHRLRDKIRRDTVGKTQNIYIHYSDQEHTYEEHIKDLLQDLSAQGIRIHTDVGNYKNHEELRYYFPQYLRDCLEEVIGRKGHLK